MRLTRAAPARPTSSWTWPICRRSAPLMPARGGWEAFGRAREARCRFEATPDFPRFFGFRVVMGFAFQRSSAGNHPPFAEDRQAAWSVPHALAGDGHVVLTPLAADAQDHGRTLRAADRSDGALVAEADHRRAVDGEDLVARHQARVRGASARNHVQDREPFGPRLEHGADPGQLDAGIDARGARRQRDGEGLRVALVGKRAERHDAREIAFLLRV